MERNEEFGLPGYLIVILIVAGISLSIWNFLSFRSLWFDEACLALNIVQYPFENLFKPLEHGQVAPIGFLIVEKFFSYLLGSTDWSLRIFPLLSFFGSIFLTNRFLFSILKDRFFALFAACIMSQSYFLIYYSVEAKQYMSDVLFCLIVLASTIELQNLKSINKTIGLAVVGGLSVWFSNVSVIMLSAAGVYILYVNRRKWKEFQNAGIIIISWVLSFAVYYKFFIYNHPSRVYMVKYWTNSNAFLPENILSFEFLSSVIRKLEMLINMLGYGVVSYLLIPIIIFGVIIIWNKNRALLLLLLPPILIHLLLTYFKLYPFSLRLVLYLIPLPVAIIVISIYYLYSYMPPMVCKYLRLFLIIPLMYGLFLFGEREVQIEREEIKEPLSYLDSKIRHDELLYVYHGAYPAFKFYKPNYTNIQNLDKNRLLYGINHSDNWVKYRGDIAVGDQDVWLLFSHVFEDIERYGLTEMDFIINVFENRGYRITEMYRSTGTYLYRAEPTGRNID